MKELMREFPPIVLNKEVNNSKNISFNKDGIFMAIPKGEKFFIWFTKYKGKSISIIINKRNKKMEPLLASYDISLCLGTVIYGTKIMLKGKVFFTVEDIFYFKGKRLYNNFSINKKYINDFLLAIKNDPKFIMFGYPVYDKNYDALINMIKDIYYPIYSIQYRDLKKNIPYLTKIVKDEIKEKVITFIVKPNIKQDIYKLFCRDDTFYSYAHIPNIKTSVFMNSIFRNIVENKNIDLIEESEDEDDFEITDERKFMKDVNTYIDCKYSDKFKMWIPISQAKITILETKETIRKIELS
jgi:hypothetical protein